MKPEKNINLKPYTVFKIGGPAKYFVEAKNKDETLKALKWAKENGEKIFILGAGSNILISDKGFDGLVIKNNTREINIINNFVEVGAGVSLAEVVNKSLNAGLVSFEWAIGIPGTMGGAVVGNAGCFGGEIKDILHEVEVYDLEKDKKYKVKNKKCEFGYRDSVFKRRPEFIILSAKLKLQRGDIKEARKKMQEIVKIRAEEQDIGAKCAGCMFKNISWSKKGVDKQYLLSRHPELKEFSDKKFIPTGFLIDRLGLKGKNIGGVHISERHGNYFVNNGKATAEEVVILIGLAKEYIHRHYGFWPETEIRLTGF